MGDLLRNASPLPSASVLTGNYRPQTAAAFVEQTLAEAKARALGSRLASPAGSATPHQKGSVEEVSALRSMASRHLGLIRQSPASPYHHQFVHHQSLPPRCISTPPLRSPSQPTLPQTPPPAQHQPSLGPPVPAAADTAAVGTAAAAVAVSGVGHPSRELSSGGAGSGPSTPHSRAPSGLQASRPLVAALSAPEPSSAGPAILEPVLGSPNGSSAHPLLCASYQHRPPPASLPRLVMPSVDESGTQPLTHASTPTGAPAAAAAASTATSQGGSPPNRAASHPAPHTPQHPQAHSHPPPQPHPVSVRFAGLPASASGSPLPSRPATSLSVQDLTLPHPTARLPSRSPSHSAGAQVLDCSRPSTSAGGRPGGGGGFSPWSTGGAAADSPSAASSIGGGSARSPSRGSGRFQHTVTRWVSESANGLAGGEAPRQQDGFKVTRGMQYSVFQELDEFDSGRLTYSAFEQAACKIGMRPTQAKRLFDQLDPQTRGFTTMREWISPSLQRQMEAFTRLYVLATRDRDGKPKDYSEIRSMHMAIQMAMVKLQLKRCGRAVSLDRLVQAFSYMDRNSDGALNAEEVEDALNSLGIFVTKEVIDTIMRTFDKDGSGGVDYFEFVKSLYPTLDQTVYHH